MSHCRRRHACLLAATVLTSAGLAHATTYSWASAVSGTFTDSSLWSPAGNPGPTDAAVIDADNPAHPTYTVSLFPNNPIGAITLNAPNAELDLRTVNGDTHTSVDSLNVQLGTLYFTSGNGTGLNHLDLGANGLTLGQVAEGDFGDQNLWQVHGTVNNNGGNLPNTLFGGVRLSGSTTFTDTFNNAGAVNTSGLAFTNNFTGSFVNYPTGTLTVQPNFHFRIAGGTFDFRGGSVDGTVEMYNGATLKTSAADVQGNGATFLFAQPGYLATHLAPGALVVVPSSLTTTSAATTNFGTIRLENTNGGTPSLTLDTDGTGFLTIAPAAALAVNTQSTIQGHLVNRGLTYVDAYLSLGSVTNGNTADDTGAFYVAAGNTTVVTPGAQTNFTQSAGLLHVEPSAHLILDHAAFHYDGGTVEGTAVQLSNNSHFTGNAADGHNATFSYTGPGTLGRVPLNTNILIDGQSVIAVGQDNYGTITLQSTNGRLADFTATDSVTFPNRGNLDLYYGSYVHGSVYSIGAVHFYGPGIFQNATLENAYIFDVAPNTPATFTDSTLRHTGGPMTLANGASLNLNHSTFSYEGGTISTTGTGSIHLANNSVLKTSIPNGNNATFYLDRDNSIQSDLSPGVTVNAGDGTLYFYDGHTNRGTLNVSSPNGISTYLSIWKPDSGTPTGTLVNNGAINFGPNSSPYVNGEIANNGSIAVKSLFNSSGQLLGTTYLNWFNGNVTLNTGSAFTVDAYSNVFFHGQGPAGSATFTLNGGTLSLGKQSHLNMLDGASFVFLSGSLTLNGATANIDAPPGGVPAASLLQATGDGASLSIATAAGADLNVAGSLIGNDGAGIVATGGGNIVATGAGNIVASGAGNITVNGGLIVASGAGKIVATGAGNLASTISAAGIVATGAGNIVATGAGNIVATGTGNAISATNGASIVATGAGNIVATGAGNIISGNAGALIGNDGASAPVGLLIAADDVADPRGVLASASTMTTPTPVSTITLAGGSVTAQHGSIAIGPDAALTGHGTASAVSFLSAGTLSPDDPNSPLTINAPATLSAGSLTGAGTLSFTQGLSITGPISKSSPGPITLAGPLSISPTASLDLYNAPLTLDPSATPATTIRQYLLNHQLFSSLSDQTHTLGYIPGLLVRLTLIGDANLDGVLNADDYTLLDRSLAVSRTSALWSDGDFNYDGQITSADYFAIDSTYLTLHPADATTLLVQRDSQFGPEYVAALLATLPEPSPLLAACGLALLPLARRRGHHPTA